MTTTLQDYFPVVIEIIMIVMLIANLLFIIYFNDVVTDYAELELTPTVKEKATNAFKQAFFASVYQ